MNLNKINIIFLLIGILIGTVLTTFMLMNHSSLSKQPSTITARITKISCREALRALLVRSGISEIDLNKTRFLEQTVCTRPLGLFTKLQDKFHTFAFNTLLRYAKERVFKRGGHFGKNNLINLPVYSNLSNLSKHGVIISSNAIVYNTTVYINITNTTRYKKIEIQVPGLGTLLGTHRERWLLVLNATIRMPIPVKGPLVQKTIAEALVANQTLTYNLCYPNISYIAEVFAYYNVAPSDNVTVVLLYKVFTDNGEVTDSFYAYRATGHFFHFMPINSMLAADCVTYFDSKTFTNLTRLTDAHKLVIDIAVLLDKLPSKGYIVTGLAYPGIAMYYSKEPLYIVRGEPYIVFHYP